MKITIEPEDKDTMEAISFTNVFEFSICGSYSENKIITKQFRHSLIYDANALIGLLKATQLDISDHKIISYANPNERKTDLARD